MNVEEYLLLLLLLHAIRHILNIVFLLNPQQAALTSPHLALRRAAVATLRQVRKSFNLTKCLLCKMCSLVLLLFIHILAKVIQREPDAIRTHGSGTERSLLKMLDGEVCCHVLLED